MSDYQHIYRTKDLIDSRRQPRHKPAYDSLIALFAKHNIQEPFTHRDESGTGWNAILNDPEFLKVCGGDPATIPSQIDYLYRVTSLDTLNQRIPQLLPSIGRSVPVGWDALKKTQVAKRRWLSFDTYFRGSLTGFRGLTWWTPADLSVDTYCTAHNTGIPDTWIATQCIVLRCRGTALSSLPAKVPSCLDGFTQPIFCSTEDAAKPEMGMCISLEKMPFALGEGREVACGPIPADEIEMLPLSFDSRPITAHKVKLTEILPHLRDFYTMLLSQQEVSL